MKYFMLTCMIAVCVSDFASAQKSITPDETKNTGLYKIVDTYQQKCFNNYNEITAPELSKAFYGQDAQYNGYQPSYTDNGDSTVTDNVTGLMWQKGFEVLTYSEATEKLKSFRLGNYSDWRLPTIKEAYSLIMFNGVDVSGPDMYSSPSGNTTAFINTKYFDFKYGSNGSRSIDVQLLSSTIYQGTTMNGMKTVFGVNIADGRIKGYPITSPNRGGVMQPNRNGNSFPPLPNMQEPLAFNRNEKQNINGEKSFTVRFVRGNTDYGKNNFKNNNNGTISDLATGLMWAEEDSKTGMNWEDALAYAVQKNKENYLGNNDWRLPNAKELQSIVDYTRSPQQTKSAAIDPLFKCTAIKNEGGKNDYAYYWTSTTHQGAGGGNAAVYICFGEALGYMPSFNNAAKKLMDVHGAGAQRSDPKAGNANEFPQGRGPQGDVIRINNFVRLVRDNH